MGRGNDVLNAVCRCHAAHFYGNIPRFRSIIHLGQDVAMNINHLLFDLSRFVNRWPCNQGGGNRRNYRLDAGFGPTAQIISLASAWQNPIARTRAPVVERPQYQCPATQESEGKHSPAVSSPLIGWLPERSLRSKHLQPAKEGSSEASGSPSEGVPFRFLFLQAVAERLSFSPLARRWKPPDPEKAIRTPDSLQGMCTRTPLKARISNNESLL